MKTHQCILVCLLAVMLCACDATTREARRMVKRAELLADTLPDSTVRLIDSVLRMPASLSERERMDMALLQAEALFGDHGQEISPVMDDDFFDEHANLSTSPELERAAAYYAGKKQYPKAAHAALYSGFVQQHYNEKEAAMRSFKEAEQYGKLAIDSLTVARAEYWMGKMLYEDYMEDEALTVLISADKFFEKHLAERAILNNLEAAAYMVLKELDSADLCLQKGLAYAEQSHFSKVKWKVLNNYAVYYRLQGNYSQATTCLRQIARETKLTDAEETLLYLNFGKTFTAMGSIDSATAYYKSIENNLSSDYMIALKDLEKEVFGDGEHWEAVKEVLDALYPGLWESLKLKYPEMDEMERRVFMMSRLKLSRLGEATLLGISTSVLDKLRTKVHRIVEEEKI